MVAAAPSAPRRVQPVEGRLAQVIRTVVLLALVLGFTSAAGRAARGSVPLDALLYQPVLEQAQRVSVYQRHDRFFGTDLASDDL
ncbi:MAG: hypothetical protein GY733_04000 [bacterium]|nr:hypothetical protein [bacterium]